eukprot:TRINITY_DN5903_c0_g1_i1.p1 TRINITY_DN5903_c0_g1~~TRINITY_DN5903_c0_g1_i1.p1  ORF type:complete len:556 (+),score=158.89 TRINITY_DN5903_c0_g1_i1:2281-3948(+)
MADPTTTQTEAEETEPESAAISPPPSSPPPPVDPVDDDVDQHEVNEPPHVDPVGDAAQDEVNVVTGPLPVDPVNEVDDDVNRHEGNVEPPPVDDADQQQVESDLSEQIVIPADGETEATADTCDSETTSIDMPVIGTLPPVPDSNDKIHSIPEKEQTESNEVTSSTVPFVGTIPMMTQPEVKNVESDDDGIPEPIKLLDPEEENALPDALSSWSISEKEPTEASPMVEEPFRPKPKRRFRPGQPPPKQEGSPTLFEAPVRTTPSPVSVPQDEIPGMGSLSISPMAAGKKELQHFADLMRPIPDKVGEPQPEKVELASSNSVAVGSVAEVSNKEAFKPIKVPPLASPISDTPKSPVSVVSDGDLSDCSVMDTFRVLNEEESHISHSPVPQLKMANIARTQNALRKQLEQTMDKSAPKGVAPIKPPNQKPAGGALAFKPKVGGVALKNPYSKNGKNKKAAVPSTFAPHKRTVSPTTEKTTFPNGKSSPPLPDQKSPPSEAQKSPQEEVATSLSPGPKPAATAAKPIPVFEPPAKKKAPPSAPKKVAKDGGGCNCTIM